MPIATARRRIMRLGVQHPGKLVQQADQPAFQRIVGVHIVGPQASELIAEATLAMRLEATVEDVIATIHAHPTLAETFREAALSVAGRPIHSAR